MRWVQAAVCRPHHCAVTPFLGSHDPEGYIDTGMELPGFDNHVYIGVRSVREMARMIDLPSKEDYAQALVTARDALRRVEELEAECEGLQRVVDASGVLDSARERKRAARPPKEKVVA